MQQSKRSLAAFLVTISAIVVLAAAPIYADSGTDGTSDGSTTTTQQTDTTTTDDTSTPTVGSQSAGHGSEQAQMKRNLALFRAEAKQNLALRRDHKALKSVTQRQKTCAHIQKAVNNKLNAFDNHATTYLTRLNDVFTKLQSYQSTNNIQAANYDSLVQTATAKQVAATSAVAALKSLGSTIDCSSSDPASMLSDVKVGAASSRDALKAYRTALKDIVVALAQAQGGTSTSTTDTEAN